MEDKQKRHIVIIGGGFAGIATANKLKRSDADVTIIDKSNHHLFQPLLYQVATAALSPGDIAAPIRAILGKDSGVKVLLGQVSQILPEENALRLADGRQVNFDQLVLAPGASYNYFGNEAWSKYAPGLKTVSDALKVREQILFSLEEAEQEDSVAARKPFLTYVIIGGGPTGVEMAGAIAEIAKRSMRYGFQNIKEEEIKIYLIEAAPTILNGFPQDLRKDAEAMLSDLGVKVLTGSPVISIEEQRVHLKVGSIESYNILWAAGIKASPLVETLGVDLDNLGRVKVEENLSVPGFPNIFVLGDAARLDDSNGKPLPALASVAKQQGQFVGNLLARNNVSEIEKSRFVYKDRGTMATVGRARAIASMGKMNFSGFFAWLLWSVIHIVLLIGFRNRLHVFIEWVWNYFTFKRGVQLITDRSACMHCNQSKMAS